MTIFILFFGGALLEAVSSHHWMRAWLWIAFGAAFLWSDLVKRGRHEPMKRQEVRR
jgi:hypothetical protein